MDRDRNLLFGVLAVQLRKLTPAQLVDAAAAWAADPSRSLPQRLVDSSVISEQERDLVVRRVDEAVRACADDPSRALETLGGEKQVHNTFRGSLLLTQAGGVRPAAPAGAADELSDTKSVLGIEEAPGRYSHIGEYGRGGMGRVWLVHDEVLGCEIALKELLASAVWTGSWRNSGCKINSISIVLTGPFYPWTPFAPA